MEAPAKKIKAKDVAYGLFILTSCLVIPYALFFAANHAYGMNPFKATVDNFDKNNSYSEP